MPGTQGTGCDLSNYPHSPALLRKPRSSCWKGPVLSPVTQHVGHVRTEAMSVAGGDKSRTSTLPPGLPPPAGEPSCSEGLDPGAGPMGLDRWLGFCSESPAAFFLWAAIWDRTLSMLPPEERGMRMTVTGPADCNMVQWTPYADLKAPEPHLPESLAM